MELRGTFMFLIDPAAARELSAAVHSGEEHTAGLGSDLKAETQRVI